MTDNTAKDGRDDVEISLKAIPAGDPRIPAMVTGEAHCRFCVDTLLSPDPRALVKWADKHEASQGHILTKQERLQQNTDGLIDNLKVHTSSQRPPMHDVPWGPDAPEQSGDWAGQSRPMGDRKMPPLPPRPVSDNPQA